MSAFSNNQKVRLKSAPDRVGRIVGDPREEAGRLRYTVDFGQVTQRFPESNLEAVPEIESAATLIETGRFAGANNLRLALIHTRLTGRLADVIYSMEASNTEFLPYQFKPVLNFIDSPSRGILLADEVGLGKTIEAGLIWTEIRARFNADRLLVLCPPVLVEKWREELLHRFGVRAQILRAKELLGLLTAREGDDREGFAAIASYHALRPPRDWEVETSPSSDRAALAALLRDRAAEAPLFDCVVMDEAHHLRNAETLTHTLGRLVRNVSDHVVLLSATPIQLRSEDLFNLLRVVDAESFRYLDDFGDILLANEPLIRLANDLRARPMTKDAVRSALAACKSHRLLANNGRLDYIEKQLADEPDIEKYPARDRLADQIERVNLLARVVNRTRKRDVQTNRVVRDVQAPMVKMTKEEAAFYHEVTSVVREYCGKRDLVEAFIQTIPQRQMCSSIPAAFRSWQSEWTQSDAVESAYEDLGRDDERSGAEDERPLISEIAARIGSISTYEELKRNDSKYAQLLESLREYWCAYPRKKVILFSYYRGTLRYLRERLIADGISPVMLVGGMSEPKHEVIRNFESDANAQILISSEVASEGVDLQFASFLINYDLPWNPMRVEQRIGRIDRIGQFEPKIQIRNFFYQDTLDQRIYDRLFVRLEIFRSALGDLEVVLGAQIQDLARYLLTHELTPAEEESRIEQTAMAIEANARQQNQLEEEAAALAAHGDYVLNQVRAAKELRRYIDGESLWAYVRDVLAHKYPGCRWVKVGAEPLSVEVSLSQTARVDLHHYLDGHRDSPRTRLAKATLNDVTACVFSNQVDFGAPGYEVVNQHHALVRFATSCLDPEQIFPTVAVQIARAAVPQVSPGVYAVVAQRWSTSGSRAVERLIYRGRRVAGGEVIEAENAERLLVAASLQAEDWLEAAQVLNLAEVLETYERTCADIDDDFERYAERMKVENESDIDFQLDAVRRRTASEVQSISEINQKFREEGRLTMIPANEGRILKLRAFLAAKEAELGAKRRINTEPRDVVFSLVCVA